MWPVTRFYEPEKKDVAPPPSVTTTTIIKHVHQYLPMSVSPMEHTALKTVSICTAALFLKIWLAANMEGKMSKRPPEDIKLLNKHKSNDINEEKLLNDIANSLNKNKLDNDQKTEPIANTSSLSLKANKISMDNQLNQTQQIKIKQKKRKSILFNIGYRWRKVVKNDLDNIPITLILAWGSLYAKSNSKITAYAISIFTISRCLHTYYYVNGSQPHRTIAFCTGLLSTFVIAINLIWSAFNRTQSKKFFVVD